MDASANSEAPSLAVRLEALSSILKSQIMTDINSWEERRQEVPGRGGKKFNPKRQRMAPLPEIPHETLTEVRSLRQVLYTSNDDHTGDVVKWAVAVLSVGVSITDMKAGSCRLEDMSTMPSVRLVMQVLVLAVESRFAVVGEEAAETALVEIVLSANKDTRAIGWIMKMYGMLHRQSFPRCLYLFAISQIPKPALSSAELEALAKAIRDLATQFPSENSRALGHILGVYRDVISSDNVLVIPEDDPRRFILFYMMQSHQGQRPVLLDHELQETAGIDKQWLTRMVNFEMQNQFSRFPAFVEDGTAMRPLVDSVEMLFGDLPRDKKATGTQHMDYGRVLGVLSFVGTLVSSADESGNSHSELLAFIGKCHETLARLLLREQELIVLSQLPKIVKNMPQPIPNGLLDLVQKNGRIVAKGPLTITPFTHSEVEQHFKRLISATSEIGQATDQNSACSKRLLEMMCETTPMLVEVFCSRLDTLVLVRKLVGVLTDRLHLHTDRKRVNPMCVRAYYRSLLAINEMHRGIVLTHLLSMFEEQLAKDVLISQRVVRIVDLMATAAEHQYLFARSPATVEDLAPVRPIISDLCSCLGVHWQALWTACFREPVTTAAHSDNELTTSDVPDDIKKQHMCARRALVRAMAHMAVSGALRVADQLVLAERALDQLAKLQRTQKQDDLGLVRNLVMLTICLIKGDRGLERVVLEKITQGLLEASDAGSSDGQENCHDAMDSLEKLLEGAAVSSRGTDGEQALELGERMLWQNSVRPAPKYPRSGITLNHDRASDAWKFVKPAAANVNTGGQPLLVLTLLSAAQSSPSGMALLAQLIEEFYVESIPSAPPILLDGRLQGGKLQLRAVEMELLLDCRNNADLNWTILAMLRDAPAGALAVKRIASALLIALAVLWNGTLGVPATRQPRDLEFTCAFVDAVVGAYASDSRWQDMQHLPKVFRVIKGADLARLLHQCVWRGVVHDFPGAREDADHLLSHVLRKYITKTASMFRFFKHCA